MPLLSGRDVVGEGVAVSDLLPAGDVPGGEGDGGGAPVDPDHVGVAAVVEQHEGGLQCHAHRPGLALGPGGEGGALHQPHLEFIRVQSCR